MANSLKMYSVHDSKAQIFHAPFFALNDAEATRTFQTIVNTKNSQINQYPTDFSIFSIGTYDENTGLCKPDKSPTHVVNAVQLVIEPKVDLNPPQHA